MLTFEEYLGKHQREDGTGPLRFLSARECLIGEILWGAATAAEREQMLIKSRSWLADLNWCMKQIDMESYLSDSKMFMEANLARSVRERLRVLYNAIWEATKESDMRKEADDE